jgi:D-xylose transport system permease protein
MPIPVAYALAAVPGALTLLSRFRTAKRRQAAGLSSRTMGGLLLEAGLITIALETGVYYLNFARGVPWMFGLFGGRGSAYSALLGIIVIQSIASGLTLLDLSSSLRYMITGGVLAIAVIVDSLARRTRVSHGRA